MRLVWYLGILVGLCLLLSNGRETFSLAVNE